MKTKLIPTTLEAPRLILRQWLPSDLPVFAQLNADAETMSFFPSVLSRQQSDAMAGRCRDLIAKNGWGFWAVELKDCHEFIGMVGLHQTNSALPFSPAVEIGWRLLRKHWGNGYASEAANSALEFGFTHLKLDRIVSFTASANVQSQGVMMRLGMKNTQQNFLHPDLESSHTLAEHVLYQITYNDWCNASDL